MSGDERYTALLAALQQANDLTKQSIADVGALRAEMGKMSTTLSVLRAEFDNSKTEDKRLDHRLRDLETTVKVMDREHRIAVAAAASEVQATVKEALGKLEKESLANVGQGERHTALKSEVNEVKDNVKWAVRGVLAAVIAALAAIIRASI